MQNHDTTNAATPTGSKMKLALGAASLFLFLVGVKRSYRIDDATEVREGSQPARSAVRGTGVLRGERAPG